MLNYIVRQSLKPRYSPIATNIRITSEWREFQCEKPYKPKGFSQHITLKITGYECNNPEQDFEIRLKDGRIPRPEIEVIDERGVTLRAEDSQRVGNQIGFRILPNEAKNLSISNERQNLTVRIRSDEPFECESLDWKTKRMK